MSQRIMKLLAGALVVAGLAACGAPAAFTTSDATTAQSTSAVSAGGAASTTGAGSSAEASNAATVLAENSEPYTAEASAADSADAVAITLQGGSIAADNAGVTVDGSVATITAVGAYRISGTLDDGQIVVNTDDPGPVSLILSGASISSSTSAPLYIQHAEAVVLVLADNTENHLADGADYVYASADATEPNAALFSDEDLVISGNGALSIDANYNDGISSDDGLTIQAGTITVTAADDGLRGKNYLVVETGSITVNAGGDGLKSDNEEDAAKGYISIAGGDLAITAAGDGVQAQTDLVVTAGDIAIVAGGGSGASVGDDASAKALKAGFNLTLDGGSFEINAAEDGLHADSTITINGGTFRIAAGDDGIHGETNVAVNGGDVQVSESYEGLESANITINAGTVSIVSSDDGVNAAGGTATGEATAGGAQQGGGGRGRRGGGNFTLTISGGTLVVEADGDGLDANGTITMTDGLVIVNGPTQRMNGALDYDGGFAISGGTLIAVGSSGMASAPDDTSGQNALLLNFSASQEAGSLVHIQDSAGNDILTFAPTKSYQSLAFSSPALASGQTYQVFVGGSATGSPINGLYSDASYSDGAEYTSFTVEGVVTRIGSGGGFR